MLNNINISKYYDSYSKIHSLNVVIKLICLILVLIVSFIVNNSICLLFVFIFVLLNIFLSNVPFRYYLGNILIMKYLLLFIIIINLLLGTSLTIIINNLLQLIIIVLSSAIIIYTTKQKDLLYGLESLCMPLKFIGLKPKKISFILSLSLRFISDLLNNANMIIKSQSCRGIDYYHGNLREKIMALKAMFMPLIINSFRKANEVATTMEVRLYDINSFTCYNKFKYRFFDFYYLFLHLLLCSLLVVKEVFL